ncbi:MAG TPA: succinate dehydrogenase/fumarate reductase iron-sulfur subunit [Xanthomonadales bacterium]|nr:succinate dehydrogenase/fumarate reductase iron-sulfur subunit [Xanthomonadales bacterium]
MSQAELRTRTLEIEVMRYDPEQDKEPHFRTYSVPCQEDWAILDALNYIKENLDSTLSYRWSCHMMVCGSCGMMINGEPSLTCKVFVRDLPDNVRVEPLANFPIERDLVVVLDDVMGKLQNAQTYIIRQDPPPADDVEYKQSPAELMKFKQYTMCINCMVCYAACPQYNLDPEFTGPAVMALAHRYNLDSRDQGRSERLDILGDHDGVWNCSFVGACSEVCPKHVDPAAAIQQMKIEASGQWVLQKLLPGRKS